MLNGIIRPIPSLRASSNNKASFLTFLKIGKNNSLFLTVNSIKDKYCSNLASSGYLL